MKLRVFTLLLAVFMIIATIPISVFAEDEAYNVWVSGVQVTAENCGDILGDGKVQYDAKRKILTLNNAEIKGKKVTIEGNTTHCGIASYGGITIESNNSTVSGDDDGVYVYRGYVTLNGTLTARSDNKRSSGFKVWFGGLVVNGTLNCTSNGENGNGLCVWGGDLQIFGTINAKAPEKSGIGMYCNGNINVRGKADAYGWTSGISVSDGYLNVNKSAVVKAVGGARGVNISNSIGSDVHCGLIVNGELYADANNTGFYGVYTEGPFMINGGKVTALSRKTLFSDAPTLGDGVTAKASSKYDGSGAKDYKASDYKKYQWFSAKSEKTYFTDIAKDAYYTDAVVWAEEVGLTADISGNKFMPDMECKRKEVVAFLWRDCGVRNIKSSSKFNDVKSGIWYEKAVNWAVENGITKGTSDVTFSPESVCTRAEIVTFIWRMAGCPEPALDKNRFTDVKDGVWYEKAVNWAVERGITTGTGADTFTPDRICTRAEIITFLYRYHYGVQVIVNR